MLVLRIAPPQSPVHCITSPLNKVTRDFPLSGLSMPPFFCVLGEFLLKELTIWVIVDLGSEQGRQVARDAISYTVSHSLPLSLSLSFSLSLSLSLSLS